MSDLDALVRVEDDDLVLDAEPPPPPDGSEVDSPSQLEALQDEQIAEYLETKMPVPRSRIEPYGIDDAGEPLSKSEIAEAEARHVFPPLPPGAGIPDELPRGHRPPALPEPSELELQIRAYLETAGK